MTQKKTWPIKITETTKPKLRTKKRPNSSSTDSAMTGNLDGKSGSTSELTEKSRPALQRLRAARSAGSAASPQASSTKARGSSSAGSSKGALAKLRDRSRARSTGQSGIALGDTVVCTWIVEDNYGGGTMRFKGRVVDLRPDSTGRGDFFTLRDKQGVEFDYYTPICKLKVL